MSYDTGFVFPYNNESVRDVGIELHGRKLHFSQLFEVYYTEIIFVDGDHKKSKCVYDITYEDCRDFLIKNE
jgi:hypothetical protein